MMMLGNAFNKVTWFVLCLLLIEACATGSNTKITIDSTAGSHTLAQTQYILLSKMENASPKYQDYANDVKRALATRGFVQALDPQKAQIAIFLSYFSPTPNWPPDYSEDNVTLPTTYSVGESVEGRPSALSTYVRLRAVDWSLRDVEESTPLWEVTATFLGPSDGSDDLDCLFPLLVAALQPYIATNADESVHVVVRNGC